MDTQGFSFHKALGNVNYCIKIATGIKLKDTKAEMSIKLEKSEINQINHQNNAAEVKYLR